jgi:transcriptional regulator with XRE-family HTH domain
MNKQFFAENVKYLREKEKLKQAEMLGAIGYKQSTWNGYERGVSTPNIDDLIKISDFFGVLESDLLRSELAALDIDAVYKSYVSKLSHPEKLGTTPRSASFLKYYNTNNWKTTISIDIPVHHTGHTESARRGVYYTNELPEAVAHLNEPVTIAAMEQATSKADAARIARMEEVIRSLKNILSQFDPA